MYSGVTIEYMNSESSGSEILFEQEKKILPCSTMLEEEEENLRLGNGRPLNWHAVQRR